MRTVAVLMIGATPGLALGYVLLSAYLLSRIVPLPITALPRRGSPTTPLLRPHSAIISHRTRVGPAWRPEPPRKGQI